MYYLLIFYGYLILKEHFFFNRLLILKHRMFPYTYLKFQKLKDEYSICEIELLRGF